MSSHTPGCRGERSYDAGLQPFSGRHHTRSRPAQEETSLFSGTKVQTREDEDGAQGATGVGASCARVQRTPPRPGPWSPTPAPGTVALGCSLHVSEKLAGAVPRTGNAVPLRILRGSPPSSLPH